ncbi:unnamed protein product [Mycena citricolor]|uniref:DUF7918 domain-containing protein n=1 Tax=Mycena citricolor TaxID=2018698 RepID=A0AAD2HSF3_9AGAR|nr:unnamed protein product [Mycena citricolor]
MLHFDTFDAWLTIDGQEAVEYGVETAADEKKVTCWIASQLGKTFAVHVRSNGYLGTIAVCTTMDGRDTGGRGMPGGLRTPSTVCIDGVSGEKDKRPFMFSSLELSDDDRLLGQSSVHQDLGRIDVQLIPALFSNPVPRHDYVSLEALKIHERSKKAVTQHVSYVCPLSLLLLRTAETLHVYEDWDSLRIYPCRLDLSLRTVSERIWSISRSGIDPSVRAAQWRLCAHDFGKSLTPSKEVLRANGIAPPAVRPPSPPAREVKPLRDTNSVEVKDEKKMEVKRGAGDVIDLTVDDSPPKKKVKRENKAHIVGEVIDLT